MRRLTGAIPAFTMKRADRHVAITDGRDPDGNVIELQEVARGEHRIALLYHRLRART
jgi:hypothetical protein